MGEKSPFAPNNTSSNMADNVLKASGSAGNNNDELARILIALDFAFNLLSWNDVKLTDIVTKYQASLDAKYHDDLIKVVTIEELDRRMATRRSGLLAQQPPNIVTTQQ